MLETTGFTSTQFNTLLSFLEKQESHDLPLNDISNIPSNSHIAGTICLFSKFDEYGWILDSGHSIDHVCNSLHFFSTVRDFSNQTHYITIPNGDNAHVTIVGDVPLYDNIILRDV